MSVRRDDGGLLNARHDTIIRVGRQGSNRRWIESLDDQPDAKRQLPQELWHDCDGLHRTALLDDPQHDGSPRSDDQGTSYEPQHGHAPWHESGGVHQVAQYQPVTDADHEAGSEQERPAMERDQRLAGRDERAGIRARSLLAQRHDRKEAEDA